MSKTQRITIPVRKNAKGTHIENEENADASEPPNSAKYIEPSKNPHANIYATQKSLSNASVLND